MLKPCLAVMAIAAASCATAPPPVRLDGPLAGKWKNTVTVAGYAMPSQEICLDKDANLMTATTFEDAMANDCVFLPFKRLDGDIRSYIFCKVDDSLTATDIRISGDFASDYTTEMRTFMDPPSPEAANPVITLMRMQRLGACAPKAP